MYPLKSKRNTKLLENINIVNSGKNHYITNCLENPLGICNIVYVQTNKQRVS